MNRPTTPGIVQHLEELFEGEGTGTKPLASQTMLTSFQKDKV